MQDIFTFRPEIAASLPGFWFSASLDCDTPRGLITGRNQNLYLVCDDPTHRFAIALRHEMFVPFTKLALGDVPIDKGKWHPLSSVYLGICEEAGAPPAELGMLETEGETLRLYVRNLKGVQFWQSIAHGECRANNHTSCEWSFMDEWDDPFFGTFK